MVKTKDLDAVEAISKSPGLQGVIAEDVERRVLSGELTEQEGQEVIKDYETITNAAKAIPEDLEKDDKTKAFELVLEKKKLEDEKATKDPAFASKYDEKIEKIDNELKEIATGEKQDTKPVEESKKEEPTKREEGEPTTTTEPTTGVEPSVEHTEIGDYSAEEGTKVKIETGKSAQVSERMNNKELINEAEMTEASDELYTMLDDVDKRTDISEESKERIKQLKVLELLEKKKGKVAQKAK
jgi:hypothetical protein